MTKFIKENFDFQGGYLTYGSDRRFVARFKWLRKQASDAGTFRTFLIKNFTVEEYFTAYDEGRGMTPLKILEAKGYILPHIRKRLKEKGYPITQEGYKQLISELQ
jgi:hypothetical protein